MDLGLNFTSKLEPFLLMSKSAKGAAAAKLIQDATSAPGVYVFGELLDMPGIQELANSPQHTPFLSLLQLFAYKTFPDYLQHKDSLPPLNPAQIVKLKHLTLVSLAAQRRILPYADLLRVLEMPTIRELEDLIIDAIYIDVLRGKFDQKEQQFVVEYTMGRDVAPSEVEGLLTALREWATTTSSVLSTLDNKLTSLATQAVAQKHDSLAYDGIIAIALKDIQDRQRDGKGKRGGNGAAPPQALGSGMGIGMGAAYMNRDAYGERDENVMDVDEPPEAPAKGKNRRSARNNRGDGGDTEAKGRKRNRFGL